MWRMRAAESRSWKLRFKSFCCVVVSSSLHFYVRIQRRYVWNKNNFSVNLTSQLSQVSWKIFQCERDDLMFWGKLKSFTEVVHGLPQPKTSKTIDLGSNQGRFNITHCRASGGMAIFLGVSAAPERILLSKISYAPVQHSTLQQKVLLWS